MEALIHVANALYLVSYSVRDVLKLRVATILAMALLMVYYLDHELWTPLAYNLLFMAINVLQTWRLVLERRPVRLAADEQRLYDAMFRGLRPRQFLALLGEGSWDAPGEGEVLVEADRALDRLAVVTDGSAIVELDGTLVTRLDAGRFVGEMCWLTGDPPRARVLAGRDCRVLRWPSIRLRDFLGREPEIRTVIQQLLGADLARKLRAPARALPG
jgi:Popeye protein conserved region